MTSEFRAGNASALASPEMLADALRSPDCVAPELFLPDEWSRLDASVRQQLLRHVALCPVCKAERQMAEAFATDDTDVAPRPVAAPRWRAPWLGALAASVLAALGLSLWMTAPPSSLPPLPAAPEGQSVMRGSGVALQAYVAPTGPVLKWEPVPGASEYRVVALDVTRQTVWSGQTERNELRPDLAGREGIGSWVWQLEALGPGGAILGVSPPVEAATSN